MPLSITCRYFCAITIMLHSFHSLAAQDEAQQVQNLRAFTKLYGYIKYFHPSDEASAIDWDRFAIYGAAQVKDAQNRTN